MDRTYMLVVGIELVKVVIVLLVDYVSATADFNQQNLQGVVASGVQGTLLPNGNFIFSWDSDWKKMVVASNDGTQLIGGYMSWNAISGDNWKDNSTWIQNGNYFTISNFQGSFIQGGDVSDV